MNYIVYAFIKDFTSHGVGDVYDAGAFGDILKYTTSSPPSRSLVRC